MFDQACEALNNMERTQLMQEATIHKAARLAVRWTVEPAAPPPRCGPTCRSAELSCANRTASAFVRACVTFWTRRPSAARHIAYHFAPRLVTDDIAPSLRWI
jgi:hypothetical protein